MRQITSLDRIEFPLDLIVVVYRASQKPGGMRLPHCEAVRPFSTPHSVPDPAACSGPLQVRRWHSLRPARHGAGVPSYHPSFSYTGGPSFPLACFEWQISWCRLPQALCARDRASRSPRVRQSPLEYPDAIHASIIPFRRPIKSGCPIAIT